MLREFYGDFARDLQDAEKALDGTRIKVPDEVSEEICPVCGRNLVVKSGRFGRFLACPGYPECSFTMPLVVEMPGRCPKCGGRLMKRTGRSKKTGKQYTYYCCEPYEHICGTGTGLTATGIPVAPGMVAVDPDIIPLGSTVIIDGQEYLAADTGGAIKGNRIDIAVETHQEALDLGVRTAEVWIVG